MMEKRNSFRATVTRLDDGSTVIVPLRKMGTPRYEYLLGVEHGFLRRTKKDYIAVLRFPRRDGILAAASNLISAAAHLAILMCNLYYHHNEK